MVAAETPGTVEVSRENLWKLPRDIQRLPETLLSGVRIKLQDCLVPLSPRLLSRSDWT